MEGLPYDVKKLIFFHVGDASHVWELRYMLGVNRACRDDVIRYIIEVVPKDNFPKRVCWTLIAIGAFHPEIKDWDIYGVLKRRWSPLKFANFLMAVQFSNEYVDETSTLQDRLRQPHFVRCFAARSEILMNVMKVDQLDYDRCHAERRVKDARATLRNEEAALEVYENQLRVLTSKWNPNPKT